MQPAKNTKSTGLTHLSYLDNGVAVISLGSADERAISLTAERLESLKKHLEHLKQQRPKGLVITGPRSDMFTVGADINLIRDVKDPQRGEQMALIGQQIYNELATLPCTTVAAISGPCVGGGCEMALACNYRIISDDKSSTIGLPEVKLGILPGFGGTQRLPRLVGLRRALDIILAGKSLRPSQALKAGLVNEIVPYDVLLKRAEGIAAGTLQQRKTASRFIDKFLTFNSFGRKIAAAKARKALTKQTRGFYPAPPAALEAVLYGLSNGIEAGFKHEAAELGKLIVTPESKCLVRIFFLTEAAKSIGKSARDKVKQTHAVVVGAGVMGAGIAGLLAQNGAAVILKDNADPALERGLVQIKNSLAKLKYLDETERNFILNRIEKTSRDSSNIGSTNLAIEAVFEDLKLKKKILGELAILMANDAIIASNTSSLSITEIASAIPNPGRVVGMHFFNPVEKMPLVEIIRGTQTTDKTIVLIAALANKLGKFPIVVNDVPGFLVNRVLTPYLNEAAWLLQEGYSIEDIDRAALDFGMPMGPLRLLDEIGLDVAVHVSEIMQKGYGERMLGPNFAAALIAQNRKGKKSGAGFYNFSNDRAEPEAEIKTMLKLERENKAADQQHLQERLIFSLINEAVRCLDEGVAGAPGPEAINQIDLGTVMGMGFPPFRGGLLYYAQTIGAKKLLQSLEKFEKDHGARYKPAEGLKKRAQSNRTLLD